MINVFLVDDHALFRQGLKLVLRHSPEIRVVGDAASYGEAVEQLRNADVDVLVKAGAASVWRGRNIRRYDGAVSHQIGLCMRSNGSQ